MKNKAIIDLLLLSGILLSGCLITKSSGGSPINPTVGVTSAPKPQNDESWTLFLFNNTGNLKSTFTYGDLISCWDGAVVGSDRGKTDFLCGRNCKDVSVFGYRGCDKHCFKDTQDKYCQDILFHN